MSKLIVIEGIDGSGKTTQFKKLVERFKEEGEKIKTHDFPRHGEKFFGVLVDRYLNNEFGSASKLDPHISSLLYACDRWEVKDIIYNWLGQGKTVILDRYATSNMGHQGGKIKDIKQREKFLNWLDELEFKTFKIPRPDKVFYLDVPVEIVVDLMNRRENKKYINGTKDGHESDLDHLKNTRDAYLYLCDKYKYWNRIECVRDNKLLTIEEIHGMIWEQIKNGGKLEIFKNPAQMRSYFV